MSRNSAAIIAIYVIAIVKFSNGSIQILFNVDKETFRDSRKVI